MLPSQIRHCAASNCYVAGSCAAVVLMAEGAQTHCLCIVILVCIVIVLTGVTVADWLIQEMINRWLPGHTSQLHFIKAKKSTTCSILEGPDYGDIHPIFIKEKLTSPSKIAFLACCEWAWCECFDCLVFGEYCFQQSTAATSKTCYDKTAEKKLCFGHVFPTSCQRASSVYAWHLIASFEVLSCIAFALFLHITWCLLLLSSEKQHFH